MNLLNDTQTLLIETRIPISVIARRTGINWRTIYKLKTGEINNPGVRTVQTVYDYMINPGIKTSIDS